MALAAGLAVLVAAFAPALWHVWQVWRVQPSGPGPSADTAAVAGPSSHPRGAPPHALGQRGDAGHNTLPWDIRPLGDGHSQVFGLTLGRSRLADVQMRFGDALQVGLVARLGEPGALEALVDPMQAGFVTGRLVLGFEVPPTLLRQWRERSIAHAPMAGGARRFTLDPADAAQALRMPLASMGFIPTLRLSEADVRERFGPPNAVQNLPDQALALLYPELGLLATVQPGSRGLLQYVAPAEFAQRLNAPLMALAASAAGTGDGKASAPR